ncbi:MAG: hypothetical protein ABIC57_02120 [bacterium]
MMPYIDKVGRKIIDPMLKDVNVEDMGAGELNYTITSLCHRWILRKGLKYINLAVVFGVLITALLELYRRIAAPYEDEKILVNGEVSKLEKRLNP